MVTKNTQLSGKTCVFAQLARKGMPAIVCKKYKIKDYGGKRNVSFSSRNA